MTYNTFVTNNMGRYIEYADPNNLNQCVDMMRRYIKDVWGFNPYVLPTALYAQDIYKKFNSTNLLVKIANTPTNMPKQGDLVFLKNLFPITGRPGHVGVYDSGDLYKLNLFGQNYPTGRPCGFWQFKYRYYWQDIVLGWIHKK